MNPAGLNAPSFILAPTAQDVVPRILCKSLLLLAMLQVNILFPSGSGETLLLPELSKVGDFKKLAQKTLGKGFLKLISVKGHVLTNLMETLQAAGVQDGEHLTAGAQQAKVAASDWAFALWFCGGNQLLNRLGPSRLGWQQFCSAP